MNTTTIVLTVTHKKPLPADATNVAADRFYNYCYSQGVEIGVTASMQEQPVITEQRVCINFIDRCIRCGADVEESK